ncbi:hypothetical protein ACQP2Y_19425 [Actinoplanes sp. CA-051413]|uniref:hypothetical protein n=1 Tax=Actinoplanes sp. CA-051413 TaxID=3239899 RepID=UPI003D9629E9
MRLTPRLLANATMRTVLAGAAGLLALLTVVYTGLAFRHRDDGQRSSETTAESTALLLDTADWGESLPDAGGVTVETQAHENIVTKDLSVIRRWQMPQSGDGFVLRQDVQTQPSQEKAHEAYLAADPAPNYREDLDGADPVSTAAAAHADEAVGYCVPDQTGCFIIHYTLRYETHVIDLSLIRRGAVSSNAEALLRTLDLVVTERLS